MHKDFDQWNELKKQLEYHSIEPLFRAGEIWWCSVGLNVAIESCGKGPNFRRPVFILKKLSRQSFIGIPLSTKPKEGTWFEEITIQEQTRWALLYQIRTFSTNRLQRRLATLESGDILRLKQKLKALLEL